MKKLLLIAAFFVYFFISPSFAQNFYIENYDVSLDVKNNRKIEVTENIDVNYTNSKEAIYRKIPLKYIIEKNNKKYGIFAKINNIKTSEPSKKLVLDNFLYVKFNSAKKEMTGRKNYKIKYTYKIPYDKKAQEDELIYDIFGNWDCVIRKINFKIKMPKQFSKDNLYFVANNPYGFNHYVENNTIIGYGTLALIPKQAIELHLKLGKNYFSKTKDENLKAVILTLIFTVIGALALFKSLNQRKINSKISFNPPYNLNSAQVGYIYRNRVSGQDIASLVSYLASKGYLKIIADGKDFKFVKLKDYQGNVESERIFFNTLFENNVDTVTGEIIEKSSYKKAYNNIIKLLKSEAKKFSCNKFENKFKLIALFICFALYVQLFYSFSDYMTGRLLINIAVALPAFIIMGIVNFLYAKQKIKKDTVILLYCVFAFYIFEIPDEQIANNNFLAIITEIICIVIARICFAKIPFQNQETNVILNQILGFKKYIKDSDLVKTNQLIQEDSAYIDKILPYLYALDLLDVWFKKTQKLDINTTPKWFAGEKLDCINFYGFSNIFDDFYKGLSLYGTDKD